jgi:hypothetical protein
VAPGSYGALVTALGYGERTEIWEVGAGGLVVGGGRAILAYTTFFAQNIARTGYVPPAIDTQISMYRSKGPTLN